ALDANGWPILAPGQAAATLMFRDIDGHYPGGVYNVTWEGTGTITFGFDATKISQGDHTMQLQVNPTGSGIYMRIEASDAADPIRNIKIWLPGFGPSYTSSFHPEFLARLQGMTTIRFMDWQRT